LQTTHSSGARLPDGSYVSILAKLSLRVYQRRYSNGSRQGASPLRQHFPYFIAKKQPMDGYSIRSLKLGLFRLIGLIGKGFSPVATPPPSPLTESYCDLPSPDKLPQAVSFVYLRDLCGNFLEAAAIVKNSCAEVFALPQHASQAIVMPITFLPQSRA
jgi:hypothetical protein